ncbi:hypothetical protein ACIA8C_09365 [Nocardia sp. NPDC051321]|uniref:hypothetical protein n=1 Tax=Nocardia sp. NPDC051321 TaxID=3364323 RepID=UPI003787A7A5
MPELEKTRDRLCSTINRARRANMTNKIYARRYGRVAAVTVSTIVVVVGLCGNAQAAAGNFLYTSPDGIVRALVDPPSSKCISLAPGTRAVTNKTDAPAHLFCSADCAKQVAAILPGESSTALAQAVVLA